jgi:DNA-binding NarL/FixJ family response regulator
VKVIRVLVVDDQALFREGLRTLLSLQPDIEVVAEAGDGEQALRLAGTSRPDVVLMDMKMPTLDGVAATRRLRTQLPECRVVALTTFDDDEYVFEALRAGAVGYLLKDASAERLVEAIRAASRGESLLGPSVASKVVAEFARLASRPPSTPPAGLSEREIDVLRLLARGASNKQIAASLFLAEGTVKNHVTNILSKLGVDDRTQAALRARELGVV